MSKRKLPQLTPGQYNLMDHIADFLVKCMNLLSQEVHQCSLLSYLTADELKALKCFLADYKTQFMLTRKNENNHVN